MRRVLGQTARLQLRQHPSGDMPLEREAGAQVVLDQALARLQSAQHDVLFEQPGHHLHPVADMAVAQFTARAVFVRGRRGCRWGRGGGEAATRAGSGYHRLDYQ